VNAITERVERGAALLDERRPGWLDLIDLDRLDLTSGCDCVAGQAGGGEPGGYTETLAILGLSAGDDEIEHGFDAEADVDLPVGEFSAAISREYAALTEAWRDLITRRREIAQASG
jgi:hypothetical protein